MEASIRTAFAYIGITDAHEAVIEYDEFGDSRLADSIRQAESAVDELVASLACNA